MAINEKDGAIETPKMDLAQKQVLAIESANSEVKSVIVKGLKEGVEKKILEKSILEIIEKYETKLEGFPAAKELYNQSMKNNTRKWYKYYSEKIGLLNRKAVKELKSAGIQIPDIFKGTSDSEKFRPFVTTNKKGLAIIEDYENKVQREIRTLVEENPKATLVDKNGNTRVRNLRNEAETRIRFQANKEDIVKLKDKTRFVMTTSHADCSPRCQEWQGRLYSLDGTSGNLDGMKFIPLENAMAGENGDGNGIITGYNCRHRAVNYKKGMRKPQEYSAFEIKKQRRIDSKQRYYENRIRKIKLEERLMREQGYEDRANVLNKKGEKAKKDYEVFSLRNKRAFYKWRTLINEEENI